MADCRLRMNPSGNEALLREVVGSPDKSLYDDPNPKCAGKHVYQMSMGKERPERIGTWELVCLADSARCRVQRGQQHPVAMQKHLHDLVDEFERILEKSKTLNGRLRKVQEALDDLTQQREFPALPKKAAEKISTQLETARGYLDGLRSDAVPANPRTLGSKAKLSSAPTTASKADRTPASRKQNKTQSLVPASKSHVIQVDDESSSEGEGHVWFRAPECEPGREYISELNTRKFIHAVIFYAPDRDPLEVHLFVPRLSCFQFVKYKLPYQCAGATFQRFSTARREYVAADKDFNLTDTGLYVLYRRSGLSKQQCPEIDDWEARVKQLDADHIAEHAHLPSQASSSRVRVEDLEDTSRRLELVGSEGVLTRSKKRKLSQTDLAPSSNLKGKGKARQA